MNIDDHIKKQKEIHGEDLCELIRAIASGEIREEDEEIIFRSVQEEQEREREKKSRQK